MRSRVSNDPPNDSEPLVSHTSTQMPPPQSSVFNAASAVKIRGGQFTSISGPTTHVSVHVDQSSRAPPTALEPPAEVFQQDHRGAVFPSVEHSGAIYSKHLVLQRRGYPLWTPEPDRNDPLPYRRQGVSIGDVGIITEEGVFSYLFNMCCSESDPRNPERLPDGFKPLPAPHLSDIQDCCQFKFSSYLASSCIWKNASHLSFESTTSEGALVVMPEGAVSHDLKNDSIFQNYVSKNLESWYRFANGPSCGRGIGNGDLRIVIGCDKAPCWGLAVLQDMSQTNASGHKLELKSVGANNSDVQDSGSQQPRYFWEYTGRVAQKTGPDIRDIESLQRDGHQPPNDGRYPNNCIFVRTLNPCLSDQAWGELCVRLPRSMHSDVPPFIVERPGSRSSGGSSRSNVSSGSGVLAGQAYSEVSTPDTSSPRTPMHMLGDIIWKTDSTATRPTTLHPSRVINRMLMRKNPNAQVVMSQDQDWCLLPDEILGGIQEMNDDEILMLLERDGKRKVVENEGCVFLEEVSSSHLNDDPWTTILDHSPCDEDSRYARIEKLTAQASKLTVYMTVLTLVVGTLLAVSKADSVIMPSRVSFSFLHVPAMRLYMLCDSSLVVCLSLHHVWSSLDFKRNSQTAFALFNMRAESRVEASYIPFMIQHFPYLVTASLVRCPLAFFATGGAPLSSVLYINVGLVLAVVTILLALYDVSLLSSREGTTLRKPSPNKFPHSELFYSLVFRAAAVSSHLIQPSRHEDSKTSFANLFNLLRSTVVVDIFDVMSWPLPPLFSPNHLSGFDMAWLEQRDRDLSSTYNLRAADRPSIGTPIYDSLQGLLGLERLPSSEDPSRFRQISACIDTIFSDLGDDDAALSADFPVLDRSLARDQKLFEIVSKLEDLSPELERRCQKLCLRLTKAQFDSICAQSPAGQSESGQQGTPTLLPIQWLEARLHSSDYDQGMYVRDEVVNILNNFFNDVAKLPQPQSDVLDNPCPISPYLRSAANIVCCLEDYHCNTVLESISEHLSDCPTTNVLLFWTSYLFVKELVNTQDLRVPTSLKRPLSVILDRREGFLSEVESSESKGHWKEFKEFCQDAKMLVTQTGSTSHSPASVQTVGSRRATFRPLSSHFRHHSRFRGHASFSVAEINQHEFAAPKRAEFDKDYVRLHRPVVQRRGSGGYSRSQSQRSDYELFGIGYTNFNSYSYPSSPTGNAGPPGGYLL